MMPGIGQVEQWRSVYGCQKTDITGERGTRSDLSPSAMRTETRKWRDRNYARILRFSFSARRPPLLF